MGWFDLSSVMNARGVADDSTISVQRSDIVIRIAGSALRQLGWKLGDRVAVGVGKDDSEGNHFGLVRLSRGEPSGWKLARAGARNKTGDLLLKFSRQTLGKPMLPDMPERLPSAPVEITIVGEAIEFRLPWIKSAAATKKPKVPEDSAQGARGVTAAAVPRLVSERLPDAAEPAALPPISKDVLRFLRDEVVPVLAPLKKTVAKNRDGTGLLLNGKPATLDEVVAEANRILKRDGDDLLVAPAVAA